MSNLPLPPLLVWSGVLLVSLAVLLKASDRFTTAAERIGYGCGLPGFLVGLTIVALGTSLPEVAVTIAAARSGRPEIAVGNVLGSNVFNALAVTGASALVGPLRVPDSILRFALPLMLIATLLGFLMIMENEMTHDHGEGDDQVGGLTGAAVLRHFPRHLVQPPVSGARPGQKAFASRPPRRLGCRFRNWE